MQCGHAIATARTSQTAGLWSSESQARNQTQGVADVYGLPWGGGLGGVRFVIAVCNKSLGGADFYHVV